MRPLRACLLDEPLPRLMAMADLWDVPIAATSAREVAGALAAHLLQEDRLNAGRAELAAEARAALEAVIAARGKMPLALFERRFGAIRPMGPGKLERERPWLSPANAAEALWYRGFVFRAFDRSTGTPTEVIFVPSDMLAVLSAQFAELSEELKRTEAAPLDSTLKLKPSALLDDVTTILCHIHNHSVKVKMNGEWDRASRLALAPMMRDPDGVSDHHPHRRFAFLVHLLERLGWVRHVNNRLRLTPQPVTEWLQSPPEAQQEMLFSAWLNDADWNDLDHVESLALEMTHTWSNDPVVARKAIVQLWLEFCAGRTGMTDALDAFVAHVKATHPDFARPDGRYDTWHVRDVRTGKFLHGFEHWERVEGALIRYVITKPLRWLAFDDVGPAEPLTPPFQVTGDGRVLVASHLRFERFQLARIADWVEHLDRAYVYQLLPASLGRAREQGIGLPRTIEFLEQNAGRPLPTHVQRALQRWGERGTEARMEAMWILRTSDDGTMEALLRIPDVRRAVVDRFAPNCVSIRPRDVEEVRAAIVQSGLLVDWM